jgi:hypothetical protein
MTPKTKMSANRKNVGAPSLKKTTLAILRHALTVPMTTKQWIKKPQPHYKVVNVTLPVSTVAKWLNVADDSVRCIERERPGYRLTEEHAEKIAYQTGVSRDWLLAGDVSKPVVKLHWMAGTRRNPYGKGRLKPFTQKDFEERQKALSRQDANSDLKQACQTVAFSCAKIAAILTRGFERGKAVEYEMKLNRALRSVYFDKDEKPAVWPDGFEPAADFSRAHFDITPTISALERRVREIQREKQGKPCPACDAQGVIACPNCHHEAIEDGKPVKSEIMVCPKCQEDGVLQCLNTTHLNRKKEIKPIMRVKMDKKTGEQVNCKLCKNERRIDCPTCKGKGRV